MKICLTLYSLFSALLLWSQSDVEKQQPLKNLVNEFHISVNHGIGSSKEFFGGGWEQTEFLDLKKYLLFELDWNFNFFVCGVIQVILRIILLSVIFVIPI